MVDALQYLTLTQPNFAHLVHVVSQYMDAPYSTHLFTVKRIFKYLQDTIDHGLCLRPSADAFIIVAYSDENWACCQDTCRLTTGYAVYFGPNLIA